VYRNIIQTEALVEEILFVTDLKDRVILPETENYVNFNVNSYQNEQDNNLI
jgi:hypothetical protein